MPGLYLKRRYNLLPNESLHTIILFLAIISVASAQINNDSVGQKNDSLKAKIDAFNQKISSIPTEFPQLPDSLLPSYNKLNFIRNDFNQKADSVENEYQKTISKIDAQTNKINGSIDSLQNLKLPVNRYTKKLDSLNQVRQKKMAEITSKVDALKAKTTDNHGKGPDQNRIF